MKKTLLSLFFYLCVTAGLFSQVMGDANEDGVIDIIDALLIAQYYVGINTTDINTDLSDVDGNSDINIIDALLVAQYYVGIISEFPLETEGFEIIRSDSQRNTSPELEEGELDELIAGNTEFALDFYRMIADSEENIVFSPYSISVVMAMCYAGAKDNTESQIADVMHFTLGQERLHNTFNALDLDLQNINLNDQYVLNAVNSLWGQTGYPFIDDFLDTLAVNYDAGMHCLDFSSDPEDCRNIINNWVSEKTEEKINELLEPGIIRDDTKLVITNTLYFRANWHAKFDPSDTVPGTFTLLDGSTTTARMMNKNNLRGSGEEVPGEYQVGFIDFYNWHYSLVIILPETGKFKEIEKTLTPETLATIFGYYTKEKILTISMPKFKFAYGGSIEDTLSDMGMEDAFSEVLADFSGITTFQRLYIMDAIHKATIAVDENGTEAAASTAATFGPPSAPPPMTMVVNRPFIFFIRKRTTGMILFAGRVLDPVM